MKRSIGRTVENLFSRGSITARMVTLIFRRTIFIYYWSKITITKFTSPAAQTDSTQNKKYKRRKKLNRSEEKTKMHGNKSNEVINTSWWREERGARQSQINTTIKRLRARTRKTYYHRILKEKTITVKSKKNDYEIYRYFWSHYDLLFETFGAKLNDDLVKFRGITPRSPL